jgi:hypothetical protein
MSLLTFSIVVLERKNLLKILSTANTYEVRTWFGNLQEISDNLQQLTKNGSQEFFKYSHVSLGDESSSINLKLVDLKSKSNLDEEFSSIGIEINPFHQNILSIDASEIILLIEFPTFSSFDFSTILEQKNQVLEFLEKIQPKFVFSTNEYEIERISNLSYFEIARMNRDLMILRKNDFINNTNYSNLETSFKNKIISETLVWFDNF